MAFASTVSPSLIMPGFGLPTVDTTGSTAVTTANTGTVTLTSFAGSGVIRYGWIRVRVYSVNGGQTITTVNITGTDGTTTETFFVAPAPTAAVAGRGLSYLIPFMTDLAANASGPGYSSVSVVVVGTGGAAYTIDAEIVGNP